MTFYNFDSKWKLKIRVQNRNSFHYNVARTELYKNFNVFLLLQANWTLAQSSFLPLDPIMLFSYTSPVLLTWFYFDLRYVYLQLDVWTARSWYLTFMSPTWTLNLKRFAITAFKTQQRYLVIPKAVTSAVPRNDCTLVTDKGLQR